MNFLIIDERKYDKANAFDICSIIMDLGYQNIIHDSSSIVDCALKLNRTFIKFAIIIEFSLPSLLKLLTIDSDEDRKHLSFHLTEHVNRMKSRIQLMSIVR